MMNNTPTVPVVDLGSLSLADSIRLVAVANWCGVEGLTVNGRHAGWMADLTHRYTAHGPGNQPAELTEGITAPVSPLLVECLDMLRHDVGDRRPTWAVNADREFETATARRAAIKATVAQWIRSVIGQPQSV